MLTSKDNLGRQIMSARGRQFLIREEGLVPWAYEDPDTCGGACKGWATFGVGHLIKPRHRGVTALDRLRFGTRSKPRANKAMRVLRRDLRSFEATVRRAAGRTLPQYKFDALVSLAFNIGAAGFKNSTAARRVREKAGVDEVAEAIRMWGNPSILRARREREVELYTRGRYGKGI